MDINDVNVHSRRVLDQVSRAVIGKEDVLKKVLMAMLSGGHVLIEDVPGLAKTLIARSVAHTMQLRFSRIQFTPDLLPGDITGATVFNQADSRFEFRHGPVFANLILADEINRASPKTQSALLEAMQEYHVTIEGVEHPLEPPFIVVATQNPIELEGTYPLPEAQLDRFIMRLAVGYPDERSEVRMLLDRRDRSNDEVEMKSVVAAEEFIAMQQAMETVYVDESIAEYIAAVVRGSRTDARVAVGASPRGSLALFKLSRAAAVLEGRDFVTPDDVKSVAVEALAHRVILKPEVWVRQIKEEDVVTDVLRSVPVPAPVDKA